MRSRRNHGARARARSCVSSVVAGSPRVLHGRRVARGERGVCGPCVGRAGRVVWTAPQPR
eukprot:2094845-Lingulodinium_polyedra.AAC.1